MTMMQVQYVKRFVLVLPFIADMTQAQISISSTQWAIRSVL